MNYADHTYYKTSFLGSLDSQEFSRLCIEASRIIDYNTNQDLTDDVIKSLSDRAQDRLKYTTCALVDLLHQKEISDSRNVSSYSIDGVSKTFNKISDSDFKQKRKDILNNLPDELTCYV